MVITQGNKKPVKEEMVELCLGGPEYVQNRNRSESFILRKE